MNSEDVCCCDSIAEFSFFPVFFDFFFVCCVCFMHFLQCDGLLFVYGARANQRKWVLSRDKCAENAIVELLVVVVKCSMCFKSSSMTFNRKMAFLCRVRKSTMANTFCCVVRHWGTDKRSKSRGRGSISQQRRRPPNEKKPEIRFVERERVGRWFGAVGRAPQQSYGL